jgi:hypothetical protein
VGKTGPMGTCRLPALLATAVVIGLAGCGGDNDPSNEPPTTSPPEPAESKPQSPEAKSFPAEFQKKVDPICVKAQAEVDKIAGTTPRDRASVQKLSDIYKNAATDLEALQPPEQNATAYKQFTDAFRDGQDLFTRLDAEVGRGDSSAYQRVSSILDEVNTDVKDLATQYGFTDCGSD